MTNDSASRDADAAGARLAFDRGTLVIESAWHEDIADLLGQVEAAWDDRVGAWRCDALHHRALRDDLRARLGARLCDDVRPLERVAFPCAQLLPLRQDQRSALSAWAEAGHRGVVVMPTGTGKTVVALHAMAQLRVSTLVVAPVRDLMYQWQRRIKSDLGVDAGVVGDSHMRIAPITVTTYDSAWIHMDELGDRFGLVIFDEVHHLPGRCRKDAALMCAAPARLGLSATPERADGQHAELSALVGPIVHRTPLSEAAGETLAAYQVVRIPIALSDDEQSRFDAASSEVKAFLTRMRKERPDYSFETLRRESARTPEGRSALKAFFVKRSIEERAQEKLRVLEDLFRLHAGQRVIVFCGSNAMALEVSRRFLVPTLLSHSRKVERQAVLEGFESGAFPAIVANQVLDEGVDIPAAKIAVVLGGGSSTRQAQQRLGRVLRKKGNEPAVLYEVVCETAGEIKRSRARRKSDAYERPKHRRL